MSWCHIDAYNEHTWCVFTCQMEFVNRHKKLSEIRMIVYRRLSCVRHGNASINWNVWSIYWKQTAPGSSASNTIIHSSNFSKDKKFFPHMEIETNNIIRWPDQIANNQVDSLIVSASIFGKIENLVIELCVETAFACTPCLSEVK